MKNKTVWDKVKMPLRAARFSQKLLLLLVFFVVYSTISIPLSLFIGGKASAGSSSNCPYSPPPAGDTLPQITTSTNTVPQCIQWAVFDACYDNQAMYTAEISWVTSQSDPSSITYPGTVPPNATLNLELHEAVYYCHFNTLYGQGDYPQTATSYRVQQISGQYGNAKGIPNNNNEIVNLSQCTSSNSCAWSDNVPPLNFTYTLNSASTGKLALTETYLAVNQFGGGANPEYMCVAVYGKPDNPTSGLTDYGPCYSHTSQLFINVNISRTSYTNLSGTVSVSPNNGSFNSTVQLCDCGGSCSDYYSGAGTYPYSFSVQKGSAACISMKSPSPVPYCYKLSINNGASGISYTLGNAEYVIYSVGPNGASGLNFTYTEGNCNANLPCPPPGGWPLNTSNSMTINLPSPAPPYSESGPPATTTSPGDYYQANPGPYEITSAYDQYSPPTSISWSPGGYQYSSSFQLNASNYVQQYPYDDHSTTVNYNENYSVNVYSTYFSHWDCPGGWKNYRDGWCGLPQTYTYCAKYKKGKCVKYASFTYYLDYPNAVAIYYYSYQYSFNDPVSATYYGTPYVPELCPRNFDVQPPTNTDVSSVTLNGGTPDSPTQVTIDSRIQVLFSLIYGGSMTPHHPMQVNGINYAGSYYIEHSDGTRSFLAIDNRSFNIGQAYSSGQTDTYNYQAQYNVQSAGLSAGDRICAEFTVSPAHGQVDQNGNQESAYGNVASTPIPGGASCSAQVENQPYSRSYGNDVSAGPLFAGTLLSCNPPNARIVANQSGSNGALAHGSGDQFAAMSLGPIQNYATAFLRSLNPISNTGLSLANNTGGYGGDFGTKAGNCPTIFNYYNMRPASTNLITPAPGNYYTFDPGNISGKTLVFVDGNVYIPSNVNYGSASLNTSNGIVTGPSLYVVALGNIYIGPGVTNLDGVYVAENKCDVGQTPPSGCGGNYNANYGGLINTCADISGGAAPSMSFNTDNLYDACTAQLTIRGSLIGDQVKLERTYGSIRNSQAGESPLSYPGNHNNDCSAGNYFNFDPYVNVPSSSSTCAAQVFNFDPINYSNNPGLNDNQKVTYDSIVSLPPVL